MMPRYIDADTASVNAFNYSKFRCCAGNVHDVQDFLREKPTVDVVEVVRCKDCKFWGGSVFEYRCKRLSWFPTTIFQTLETGFCSHGERKEI